ncbi:MAG: hypothetical protein OXH57_08805 [Ekhidna sp.]|nr:hypothetical protein [Ekhidna sp.]
MKTKNTLFTLLTVVTMLSAQAQDEPLLIPQVPSMEDIPIVDDTSLKDNLTPVPSG